MQDVSATVLLNAILALILLQTKHLIVDWVWQPPFEHENKGIYGHWGGVRHALKNALGTVACVWLVYGGLPISGVYVAVFLFDFTVHYHIDWSKKQLTARYRLGPTTHPEFWWLTGFDQYLHQLTYLVIVLAVGFAAGLSLR